MDRQHYPRFKTLSPPIRGYAEVLLEDGGGNEPRCGSTRDCAQNAAYMECLIDDLKLTYQLEKGSCLRAVEGDVVRFFEELAIDILNALIMRSGHPF